MKEARINIHSQILLDLLSLSFQFNDNDERASAFGTSFADYLRSWIPVVLDT